MTAVSVNTIRVETAKQMEPITENHRILKLDPRDNVLVALTPVRADETITFAGKNIKLPAAVPAKFKFVESAVSW